MELAAGEARFRTLVGEGFKALKSGEEVREEGVEKWVFRPVRRFRDFRNGGFERDELRA